MEAQWLTLPNTVQRSGGMGPSHIPITDREKWQMCAFVFYICTLFATDVCSPPQPSMSMRKFDIIY